MIPRDVPSGLRYAWWANELANALGLLLDHADPGTGRVPNVVPFKVRLDVSYVLAGFHSWEGQGLDRLADAIAWGDHEDRWVLTDKGMAATDQLDGAA